MTSSRNFRRLCQEKINLDIKGVSSCALEGSIISALRRYDNKNSLSLFFDDTSNSPHLKSLSDSLLNSAAFGLDGCRHKGYLLVGGVGRSGTTALGKAIGNILFKSASNTGCNGFIFTERYSWKLPYSPFSFLPSYVFAPDERSDGFSGLSSSGRQIDALKRYQDFEWVGDKRPGAAFLLKLTDYFFCKAGRELVYIHLFRDPVPTAKSWLARSLNPGDRWPSQWDHVMMSSHYIAQSRIVKDCIESGLLSATKIILIEYEKFFFDSSYCARVLDDLLRLLGIACADVAIGDKIRDFVASNVAYRASRANFEDVRSDEGIVSVLEESGCLQIYKAMLDLSVSV